MTLVLIFYSYNLPGPSVTSAGSDTLPQKKQSDPFTALRGLMKSGCQGDGKLCLGPVWGVKRYRGLFFIKMRPNATWPVFTDRGPKGHPIKSKGFIGISTKMVFLSSLTQTLISKGVNICGSSTDCFCCRKVFSKDLALRGLGVTAVPTADILTCYQVTGCANELVSPHCLL